MFKIKDFLPEPIATKLRCWKYELTRNHNFKKYHNYNLCINKPNTFSEKIYYRKYFGNHLFMAEKADKYLVRNYVEKKIGKEILIPLLGCHDFLDEKIWESLPEKFVLKTNHGSGPDHIEIVKSKRKSNKKLIIEKMNKAVKQSFGKLNHQPFYDLIERKIIVEEYLETELETPDDYKFHVFKNTIFIQVDVGRYTEHKRSFYDVNWDRLDLKINSKYEFACKNKPDNLDSMIDIARTLAQDYDYVRVDLYNVNGKIYFGEITQTHGNGTENFEPASKDLEWGRLWILDESNKSLYK
ncbi:conserved hypothetical protein [Vibrio chagasii]|nr:conserved hypothetical protein [Vibrio chagasii]CAH7392473.1 conserved hypothetical protein [Vibrio chagasii]CAH7483101.1 conserved hypothetical protein [Vibrio chagasii]